ncbi:hypothetical protein JHK86_035329 [Glycine max]|nr:hypothetical protein JHK86_035329 [Glycine max]
MKMILYTGGCLFFFFIKGDYQNSTLQKIGANKPQKKNSKAYQHKEGVVVTSVLQ